MTTQTIEFVLWLLLKDNSLGTKDWVTHLFFSVVVNVKKVKTVPHEIACNIIFVVQINSYTIISNILWAVDQYKSMGVNKRTPSNCKLKLKQLKGRKLENNDYLRPVLNFQLFQLVFRLFLFFQLMKMLWSL